MSIDPDVSPLRGDDARQDALRNVTAVIYGLFGAAFLVGITAIAAIVMVYVKRDEARGTWLESHYLWLVRSFWFGLLWGVIGFITFIIVIGWFILAANAVWLIYRIVKGWLNLYDGKPMYAPSQAPGRPRMDSAPTAGGTDRGPGQGT